MTNSIPQETTGTPGVFDKIRQVMELVGWIPKNGRNTFHKYDYVTESDLTDALRPIMAKIGLVMLCSQGEREDVQTKDGKGWLTRILHTFTFVDTGDASSFEITVWGDGYDSLDKCTYKAFTGATKYALMKTFQVSTGNDPERDNGHGDSSDVAVAVSPRNLPASAEAKRELTELYVATKELIDDAQRTAIERIVENGTVGAVEKTMKFLNDRKRLFESAGNKVESSQETAAETKTVKVEAPEVDDPAVKDAADEALAVEAGLGLADGAIFSILEDQGLQGYPTTVEDWNTYESTLRELGEKETVPA